MSEQVRKFVLVVRRNDLDDACINRLTEYMANLDGTSLTHKALQEEPNAGMTARPAAVIAEWFSRVSPERSAWAEALSMDDDQLQWYAVSEVLRWRRPGSDPPPDISGFHTSAVWDAPLDSLWPNSNTIGLTYIGPWHRSITWVWSCTCKTSCEVC